MEDQRTALPVPAKLTHSECMRETLAWLDGQYGPDATAALAVALLAAHEEEANKLLAHRGDIIWHMSTDVVIRPVGAELTTADFEAIAVLAWSAVESRWSDLEEKTIREM